MICGPVMPVLSSNGSRILPLMFWGGQAISKFLNQSSILLESWRRTDSMEGLKPQGNGGPFLGGDFYKPRDKSQELFKSMKSVPGTNMMWLTISPKGMNNTVKAKIQITQHFYCYANEVKLEYMSICRGQLRVSSWHPSTNNLFFIWKKKTYN